MRTAEMDKLHADIDAVLTAKRVADADLLSAVRDGIAICKLVEAGVPLNLRTNVGVDALSTNLLNFQQGGPGVSSGGSYSGTTATAPTATTFTTDAVNFPTNSLVGQIVVTTSGSTRFGIIQSNTSATNSVLTIDRWYDSTALPADPGVAAASTPTAGAWAVVAGGAPAGYMALANSSTATAPAATDTTLTGEIVTASGGLIRKLATYAHTAASSGAGTTTLTKTWTANGSDSLPVTVSQIGVFQGVVVASSRMFFKTALNATATLSAVSDQVQVTETVTL